MSLCSITQRSINVRWQSVTQVLQGPYFDRESTEPHANISQQQALEDVAPPQGGIQPNYEPQRLDGDFFLASPTPSKKFLPPCAVTPENALH